MLRVLNLDVAYGSLRVLKGISLHVSAGEAVALIGANGAGKTTLLKAIVGLQDRLSGTLFLDNKPIHGEPSERIVELGCSLVPEGRHVFGTLTVRENLLLGAFALRRRQSPQETAADLDRIYGLFGILKERHSQLAGTLSGGQQQMLAIGRALMSRPRVLMMDEPSLGVAPLVTRSIFEAITGLKKNGLTILLVEQNARAALAVADRGYVIETGQIVLEGTSRQLSDNPEVRRAYLGKEYRRIDE
jgi:branched-chain amino acid transport system ATP-binding protein